jgi:hypothetical protein
MTGGLLIAYGIIGFSMGSNAPACDPGSRGKTMTDTMHIVLTVVKSLLIMLAVGFGAAALGKGFRRYSVATILVLLVFGALTGQDAPELEANLPTPWMGVLARINIYANDRESFN